MLRYLSAGPSLTRTYLDCISSGSVLTLVRMSSSACPAVQLPPRLPNAHLRHMTLFITSHPPLFLNPVCKTFGNQGF